MIVFAYYRLHYLKFGENVYFFMIRKLTGQSMTSAVAGFGTATGFGIQAYQAADTGSNTSYTDVAA